jgi:hypothetical protein
MQAMHISNLKFLPIAALILCVTAAPGFAAVDAEPAEKSLPAYLTFPASVHVRDMRAFTIEDYGEAEFRKHAHLDQPELMPKREQCTPVGDLLVSFLKLQFRNSASLFLMTEFSVKLPAENQSFMRFLLSKTGFHMRLRGGGVGVVNLAQLTGYTVYPGVAQVPSDTWAAEPTTGIFD